MYLGKSVSAWCCRGEHTALTGTGVSLAVAVSVGLGSRLAVEDGAGLGVTLTAGATQAGNKATRRSATSGFTSQF